MKCEWMLSFIFGNKRKSNKVLTCGFHLAAAKEFKPDPHKDATFQTATVTIPTAASVKDVETLTM